MTPEEQSFIEKNLFPIMRAKIREQLDLSHLSVEPTKGGIHKDGKRDPDCLYISDGVKYLAIPIMTPMMKNVSLAVDVIAFKRYILE